MQHQNGVASRLLKRKDRKSLSLCCMRCSLHGEWTSAPKGITQLCALCMSLPCVKAVDLKSPVLLALLPIIHRHHCPLLPSPCTYLVYLCYTEPMLQQGNLPIVALVKLILYNTGACVCHIHSLCYSLCNCFLSTSQHFSDELS